METLKTRDHQSMIAGAKEVKENLFARPLARVSCQKSCHSQQTVAGLPIDTTASSIAYPLLFTISGSLHVHWFTRRGRHIVAVFCYWFWYCSDLVSHVEIDTLSITRQYGPRIAPQCHTCWSQKLSLYVFMFDRKRPILVRN